MASLTSDALFKYDPNQPRDETGKWTATGGSGITTALFDQSTSTRREVSLSFDAVEELVELNSTYSYDYIDNYLEDELYEEMDRLKSLWVEENPDAEVVSNFRTPALQSLASIAENAILERREELESILFSEASDLYSISGTAESGQSWNTSVVKISTVTGELGVVGEFFVDGVKVGDFTRHVANWRAYRSLLKIDEEYSGLGIASAFNKHEEEMYRAVGIPEVHITAADLSYGNFNQAPGTYVWASRGYDWRETPSSVKNAVESYKEMNFEYQQLPDAIRETVDSVLSRMSTLSVKNKNYPTPKEISQLGRLPDSDWWPGKSIMAHSGSSEEAARAGQRVGPSWSAVKRLNEPLRTTEGGVLSEQIRQQFAETNAVERVAALSQFARANPNLNVGDEFITINGQPVPVEKSVRLRIRDVEKYDPNQPRDETGKWTATGGSASQTPTIDLSLIGSSSGDMTAMNFVEQYMPERLEEVTRELYNDHVRRTGGLEPYTEEQLTYVSREQAHEDLFEEAIQEMQERGMGGSALLEQQVMEAFSVSGGTKDGKSWTANPDVVSVFGVSVTVSGRFFVDGEFAGRFERSINEEVAYRSGLVVEDKFARLGIAEQFNAHEEAVYRASGVENIRLTASDLSAGDFNKPPGSYVWASRGYDFSQNAWSVLRAVENYVSANPEFGRQPKAVQDTINSVLTRMSTQAVVVPTYPTPREISQLGRFPDSDWWPGKSIMAHNGASEDEAQTGYFRGPTWDAIKRLNQPDRVTSKEVLSETVRASIGSAGEAQRIAGLEQFKRANPRLAAGDEFITINGQPVPVEKSVGPMIDTVEKYDPNQPRDETGKWTATGGSGVSAAPSVGFGSAPFGSVINFSEVEELSNLEDMYVSDYIENYLEDALYEEIAHLESLWEEENPDEAMLPDFRDEALQSLYDMAEGIMDDRKLEIQQSLYEQASDLYSIDGQTKNGEYWETSVESVFASGGELNVEGSFFVDGAYVGRFERTISEFDAYRALLVIDEEYSGVGISAAFNKHEEEMYRAAGIPKVRISAADLSNGNFNQAPGTYAWASQGYDWADTPFYVRSAVQNYVESNPEYRELPAALRETVDSVAFRIQNLSVANVDFPTPREISQLGRLPDSDWWAGKSIMAHNGAELAKARSGSYPGPRWSAVKELNEPLRTTEAGNIAERVRQEFAEFGAAQRVAAIAQFRQMNPQLGFDPNFITINGMAIPLELTDAQIERKLGI